MSIAQKLSAVAENMKKFYDGTRQAAREQLWNVITIRGGRNIYSYAFARTDFTGVDFIKPIVPGHLNPSATSVDYMFYIYRGSHLPGNIDLSKVPAKAVNSAMFAMSSLVEIYDMGLCAMNSYLNAFYKCETIKKIPVLRTHKGTTFSGTFYETFALEDITFEGVIGQNLNVSYSTKLSRESLINIIDCLYDYASDGDTAIHKLNLGSANLDKLSDDEQQIATDKGWTLS